MLKRPFSDADIEQLKVTVYVPPKPLSFAAIFLLVLFWPAGIYYLVRSKSPEYMLSKCRTNEEREALFAYLKSTPKASKHDINYFPCHSRFERERYIPGTPAYNITHPSRR